ncbi:hypothetical protein GCM10027029_31860 [Conyzicola lurida]
MAICRNDFDLAVAAAPSAESVATLVAAVIAAAGAVTAAVIGAVNASKARQWVGRDQWWTRFSWAIGLAISRNPRESELGLSVLISLIDVPWARTKIVKWLWPWRARSRHEA